MLHREVDWDPMDIVVTRDDKKLPYQRNRPTTGRSYKIGQVKLLISEILFLINHWDPNIYPKIHIVVAGSVTGEHFACLAELFPMVDKIDLWDPKNDLSLNRPGKKQVPRIEFINKPLTPEEALRYKGAGNIYFISDLRTVGARSSEYEFRLKNGISADVILNKKDMIALKNDKALNVTIDQEELLDRYIDCSEELVMQLTANQMDTLYSPFKVPLTKEENKAYDIFYDKLIWQDHDLQKKLVEAIQPRQALLKFRVPYNRNDDPKEKVSYFDGYVYKQAFSGTKSSECRLVPILWQNNSFNPIMRNYSLMDYEQIFSYYNNRLRDDQPGDIKIWRNPIDGRTEINDNNRLINSFDTCYLLYVLNKYLDFMSYNGGNRYDTVMALWDWIIETINYYKSGKPLDFEVIRNRSIFQRYVPGERKVKTPKIMPEVYVPESLKEDIVEKQTEETEEVPGFLTLSFGGVETELQELGFDDDFNFD